MEPAASAAGSSRTRTVGTAVALLCFSLLFSSPVFGGCNSISCWDLTITDIFLKTDGAIWFLTDDPDGLAQLAPPSGCTMPTQRASGSTQTTLYIRPDDPDREAKYMMLLIAYTTGAPAQVLTALDPATGLCSLGEFRLR